MSDYPTKRSISKMCAGLLASTQVENSAPAPSMAKGKKGTKKKKATQPGMEEDDSEEEEVAKQQAEAAAASTSDAYIRTLLTPNEVLNILSNVLLRPSSTRKLRLAILDTYSQLFETLGSKWCGIHYGILMTHLFDYVPNNASSSGSFNVHEFLVVKKAIQIIARDLIGTKLLSEESSQIAAIQELSNSFLKNWPILTPGKEPTSRHSLALSLNEISSLLVQLGNCPPPVFEVLYDSLVRLLGHWNTEIQLSSAWCLVTLCDASPGVLDATIEKLLGLLKE